jgi:hypothetical protein
MSGVLTYWPFGLRWSSQLCQKCLVGDAGGGVKAGYLFDLGADRELPVPATELFDSVTLGYASGSYSGSMIGMCSAKTSRISWETAL